MQKTKHTFLVAAMLLCIHSCKDDYTLCDLSKIVDLNAGFYSYSTGSATTSSSFTLSQLGSAGGSIYASQQGRQTFTLPLSPLVDSAQYLINVSTAGPTDTITFVYSSQSVNLSAQCGNVEENTLTAFRSTRHSIDSVAIINPEVNTAGKENVRIYF